MLDFWLIPAVIVLVLIVVLLYLAVVPKAAAACAQKAESSTIGQPKMIIRRPDKVFLGQSGAAKNLLPDSILHFTRNP